ncbi:MAG: 2-hydroxyacyl-CoA dehydratase family protein [Oscillibacter sp.]|jgi:benzoyl-CoA reductase/2-hydroxyglutaryl-CoA dehydratase subunit BcrC/BadD/HgdB|nr:2-hydroxyacyl-CoA dehydratase family protein [Oscillibacter sp.]
MADQIEKFGKLIDTAAAGHPAACRQLLLAGYRAFGVKLRFRPDPRLPASRQYLALLLNRAVVDTLSHPESTVLTSVFLPCELLHAMDLRPMCAELYSAFLNGAHAERAFAEAAEAAGIAETYCSYHKILLGSAYTGVLPRPACVANTSLVCDANNLTFRALSQWYGVPQYYVDVPPRRGEESLAYVTEQLRELAAFLEKQTGRRLDPDRLSGALTHTRQTVENFRSALAEKAVHSLPGDITSEMYEIYASHIALGTEAAERYSRMLLDDLRAAPAARGLRLLWLHTIPNWQQPVREALNFSPRAQILSCDINFEGLVDIDPDKPYESMARRLVASSWNGGGENRIAAARAAARALHADGVVCFCHWGCKQTMGLSARFREELEADGFPTLILNGDGCDRNNSSDGQVSTRLRAFLELLEGRTHA